MNAKRIYNQESSSQGRSNAVRASVGVDSDIEGGELGKVITSGTDRISSRVIAEDQLRQSTRVAEIKEAIANGTYAVSSEDVAQSVVAYFDKDEAL